MSLFITLTNNYRFAYRLRLSILLYLTTTRDFVIWIRSLFPVPVGKVTHTNNTVPLIIFLTVCSAFALLPPAAEDESCSLSWAKNPLDGCHRDMVRMMLSLPAPSTYWMERENRGGSKSDMVTHEWGRTPTSGIGRGTRTCFHSKSHTWARSNVACSCSISRSAARPPHAHVSESPKVRSPREVFDPGPVSSYVLQSPSWVEICRCYYAL